MDLLPQGYGRANITGDSLAMVSARRRFLAAGHYSHLLEAITAQVREHIAAQREGVREGADAGGNLAEPRLLDAGCGDGYYGGNVAASVARQCGACRLYGLDISRAALKLAARTWRDGVFFRNDIGTRICVADGAADVLLDIFAPRHADEFARVLRPGGLAVVVVPDESHLHELRTALPLLSIQSEKRDRVTTGLAPHFYLREDSAISSVLQLSSADLHDLIAMSPSAHHVDEAQLTNLPAMDVTTAFHVLTFVRRD